MCHTTVAILAVTLISWQATAALPDTTGTLHDTTGAIPDTTAIPHDTTVTLHDTTATPHDTTVDSTRHDRGFTRHDRDKTEGAGCISIGDASSARVHRSDVPHDRRNTGSHPD
jgi:hypothetical protein